MPAALIFLGQKEWQDSPTDMMQSLKTGTQKLQCSIIRYERMAGETEEKPMPSVHRLVKAPVARTP